MIFVTRAAIIAIATFVSALAGFGLQSLLPASYVAASKGSVVGLDATLLALVLGLLIWTSHGLFTAQQSQLQTIGRAINQLDLAFNAYGRKQPLAARSCANISSAPARACGRTTLTGAASSSSPTCPPK